MFSIATFATTFTRANYIGCEVREKTNEMQQLDVYF